MAADKNDKAVPSAKSSRTTKAGSKKRASGREGNVGNALRTVYQQTVNEDIPSELLDLLGKLK